MQTATQAPPPATPTPVAPTPAQPAGAPAPVAQPPLSITIVGADGKPQTLAVPRSRAEIRELNAQRNELSGQLSNVTSRRRDLAVEIANTSDPAIRAGLESRLALLDQRILQLETDLAVTGRRISAAPQEFAGSAEGPPQDGGFEEGMMIGGFSVLAFASVIFFFARRRWKRRRPAPPAADTTDASQRLERLEHGMDAIAVEIERISEGQRFVTRLLSESQTPFGQPQRIAKPVAAEREDPAKR